MFKIKIGNKSKLCKFFNCARLTNLLEIKVLCEKGLVRKSYGTELLEFNTLIHCFKNVFFSYGYQLMCVRLDAESLKTKISSTDNSGFMYLYNACTFGKIALPQCAN